MLIRRAISRAVCRGRSSPCFADTSEVAVRIKAVKKVGRKD